MVQLVRKCKESEDAIFWGVYEPEIRDSIRQEIIQYHLYRSLANNWLVQVIRGSFEENNILKVLRCIWSWWLQRLDLLHCITAVQRRPNIFDVGPT